MISADEALKIVLDNVAPLGVERASIVDALGRVLAEEIRAVRRAVAIDEVQQWRQEAIGGGL